MRFASEWKWQDGNEVGEYKRESEWKERHTVGSMNFFILTYLFSVALADSYKRENLKCHLQPGDSVEMTGKFTSTAGKVGMALAMRSATTMPFRVEVFPGLKAFILRSQTPGQYPPKLVKQGAYSGDEAVKIKVLVGPMKNYQVWINDIHVGPIPFIGGPAPTYIETNHDIDTESLQVFSTCAANPATTGATTASAGTTSASVATESTASATTAAATSPTTV